MSLLILSKATDSDVMVDKAYGVLCGQVTFATYIGKYHTPWVDTATYSSIACRTETRRTNWSNNRNKFDEWGRIKRTEFWG